MGKRGWPLEAESGDHVTCQWCCGVVVENDAVVEHEESVFLCDGCNTAWCHSCLGANVGAGYVQQVAGAPDDVQWRCLYCDDALWATLAVVDGRLLLAGLLMRDQISAVGDAGAAVAVSGAGELEVDSCTFRNCTEQESHSS